MKKTIITSLSALSFSLVLFACQNAPTSDKNQTANLTQHEKFTGDVLTDPKVIKGTLSNGINYLIRKNAKPEKRAEIRLVVNAGSVLEDESQLGFAHFAEHMAFNGTEDFKKQEIVEYVESIGMKFGAHLNAHTSFDETVYKLQIPSDEPETLEKGIHILENWAHKISFEPEEIDKERGVVIEELRLRQGARSRMMYKQLPTLYKDSRYAERLPIGKKDILENGSHEDLIRFYKDWYRPELMSLIAVGDIEPEQIKALFEKYFSKIKPATKDKKTRTTYSIPQNIDPLISINTDPELTRTIVSVIFKQPLFEPSSYEDYRKALTYKLFLGMLNSRYAEHALTQEASIIGGGARFRRSFGDINQFSIGAAVKPGKAKEALAYIISEVNRANKFGFTEAEFTRQKASIKTNYEKMAKEANNVESPRLAAEYVRHFMKNESIPGSLHESEIALHFLPSITLAQVNAVGSTWMQKENRLISITAPTSEQENIPTSDEALAIWQHTNEQTIAPYIDTKVAEQLITNKPVAGSVTTKTYDEATDSHTWILSNGVKVVLKQTDFKEDSIVFQARNDGGYSLVKDEDVFHAYFANPVVSSMGLGEFSVTDLRKFMKGKSFKLKAKFSGRNQELIGNSSVKDIETFMQALHLRFQPPREDKAAFDTLIGRMTPYYQNQFNSPNGVFKEAIRLKQFSDEPRSIKIDAQTLKTLDMKKSADFFHQRFSNAANYNFVFVGNIDLAQMEQLVSTYLASLPAHLPEETWIKRENKRNKGELSLTVEKGLEPKATVSMTLYGDTTWSHREVRKFDTLKGVLKTILRERIREEKSGVYGVRVGGGISKDNNDFNLSVSFTCDPLRVDELIAEVKVIFEEIKTANVDKKYVDNFIEQSLKTREVNLKKNWFWRIHLLWLAEPDADHLSLEDYNAILTSMTVDDVKVAATHYLNWQDSLIAKLMPEPEVMKKAQLEAQSTPKKTTAK